MILYKNLRNIFNKFHNIKYMKYNNGKYGQDQTRSNNF